MYINTHTHARGCVCLLVCMYVCTCMKTISPDFSQFGSYNSQLVQCSEQAAHYAEEDPFRLRPHRPRRLDRALAAAAECWPFASGSTGNGRTHCAPQPLGDPFVGHWCPWFNCGSGLRGCFCLVRFHFFCIAHIS